MSSLCLVFLMFFGSGGGEGVVILPGLVLWFVGFGFWLVRLLLWFVVYVVAGGGVPQTASLAGCDRHGWHGFS